MSTPVGILAFIFILGSAVILHEFGHFIVAKLFKIRVETFSVGFGPRLFGKKFGHTDYRVSAIPLGGYVKLGGDESNACHLAIPPSNSLNLESTLSFALLATVSAAVLAMSLSSGFSSRPSGSVA